MESQKPALQNEDVWIIDPDYTTVLFEVRNLFFTARGRFTRLSGTITRTGTDVGDCRVEATIKAPSIVTGIERRDAHLRSHDFLDAARYPEMRFESSLVEKGIDRDTLRVKGFLTIRDQKREIVLDVTAVERSRSPQGQDVAYYTVVARLNRFDFGVSYGRWVIGADVRVRIHVQAVRK
jgi:polyisoprenoid-binding protein YceI